MILNYTVFCFYITQEVLSEPKMSSKNLCPPCPTRYSDLVKFPVQTTKQDKLTNTLQITAYPRVIYNTFKSICISCEDSYPDCKRAIGFLNQYNQVKTSEVTSLEVATAWVVCGNVFVVVAEFILGEL